MDRSSDIRRPPLGMEGLGQERLAGSRLSGRSVASWKDPPRRQAPTPCRFAGTGRLLSEDSATEEPERGRARLRTTSEQRAIHFNVMKLAYPAIEPRLGSAHRPVKLILVCPSG